MAGSDLAIYPRPTAAGARRIIELGCGRAGAITQADLACPDGL
jgi:hypothetical protein